MSTSVSSNVAVACLTLAKSEAYQPMATVLACALDRSEPESSHCIRAGVIGSEIADNMGTVDSQAKKSKHLFKYLVVFRWHIFCDCTFHNICQHANIGKKAQKCQTDGA